MYVYNIYTYPCWHFHYKIAGLVSTITVLYLYILSLTMFSSHAFCSPGAFFYNGSCFFFSMAFCSWDVSSLPSAQIREQCCSGLNVVLK